MVNTRDLGRVKGILKTRILRTRIGSHATRHFFGYFWIKAGLIFIVASILVRSFLWQPFAIPSQSMLPTIFAGDYIFASKYAYGYNKYSLPFAPNWFSTSMKESAIKRGDVIVYRGEDNRHYVKRIIGMPKDRIQMVAGALHIDGKAVKKERVTDFVVPETSNSPCLNPSETRKVIGKSYAVCRYARYKETLVGDKSYMTLDLTPAAEYDTSKLVMVPPRYYYVMGDNRDFSLDSRVNYKSGAPHLVEMDRIIGKAGTVFISYDGSVDLRKIWHWHDGLRSGRVLRSLED